MKDKNGKEIEEWQCPRCKEYTTDYPAISRTDNKTEICSACGVEQALEGYVMSLNPRIKR